MCNHAEVNLTRAIVNKTGECHEGRKALRSSGDSELRVGECLLSVNGDSFSCVITSEDFHST